MTALKVVGVIVAVALAGGTAAAYAAFGAFLPWRERGEAQRLADIAGIRPGQTVAEIGAGTGRFTAVMSRRVGTGGTVLSTELDPERRREIEARMAAEGLRNVRVVAAAPDATNLPDACCDVVFLRNVYHHVTDPTRFAVSVARAVKPDGVVVVIDFEPGALWLHGGSPDGSPRAGHGVSRTDAIVEFRAAGFEAREQFPSWSGPLWLVLLRRPVTPGAGPTS